MYTYNVALTVPAPFVITTSLYISVKFDNLNQIPAPATLISAAFPFTVIVPKSASANDTYNPNVSSAGWILTISLIAPSLIALYVSLYVASDELIKSSADQSFSAATGTVGATGAGVVVSSCLAGVVVSSCLAGVVVSSCLADVVVSSSFLELSTPFLLYTYNVALTVPAPFVITTSLYISVKFDNLNQIPAPATLISAAFPFTVIVPKSASANDTYNPNVSSAGWILTISLIAPSLIALYVSLYVASDELIKSSADQSFSAATGTVGATGAGVVVSSCLAGVVVSSCLAGVVVSPVPGSTTGVFVVVSTSATSVPYTPISQREYP